MNDAIIDEVLKRLEDHYTFMESMKLFGSMETIEKTIGVIAHLRAKNAELEKDKKLYQRIVEALTSQQPEEKDK